MEFLKLKEFILRYNDSKLGSRWELNFLKSQVMGQSLNWAQSQNFIMGWLFNLMKKMSILGLLMRPKIWTFQIFSPDKGFSPFFWRVFWVSFDYFIFVFVLFLHASQLRMTKDLIWVRFVKTSPDSLKFLECTLVQSYLS